MISPVYETIVAEGVAIGLISRCVDTSNDAIWIYHHNADDEGKTQLFQKEISGRANALTIANFIREPGYLQCFMEGASGISTKKVAAGLASTIARGLKTMTSIHPNKLQGTTRTLELVLCLLMQPLVVQRAGSMSILPATKILSSGLSQILKMVSSTEARRTSRRLTLRMLSLSCRKSLSTLTLQKEESDLCGKVQFHQDHRH
ncbi:hypothetical protein L207DRAFT_341670 [Hyaloscypha variabilis F]|uniref:Uncharacterized protein n=1 Tax=Hyaloscypha variabilis (strain UAMH 11265 / GT02V1 / F) TaxID=1149755 RepID=A0A2J6RPY3_HYAVF|nr:hypothetical protein L207DRAFT_341670 [Hyaloscypha variabilis F]